MVTRYIHVFRFLLDFRRLAAIQQDGDRHEFFDALFGASPDNALGT